jgi:glucose 1-dehydrogenase
MGRVANIDEVANVVEFLASNKASYVTGATFFVDGELTLLALVQVKTII